MSHRYFEKEWIEKNEKYIVHMPGFVPLIIMEAKGSIYKDINGKEYIDCASGVAGVMGIGHSHPNVIKAAKEQIDKLLCGPPWFISLPKVELAEKLAKIMPGNLNKFYFLCGGGEAVEFALKNAIKVTKKQGVIGLYSAYHGATIACLSLGQPWHRKGLPAVPGFRQIPPAYCYRCFYGKKYPGCNFECAKALEDTIRYGTTNNVAAVIMEPVLGNGGHIAPPDKEYFKIIREICDKYGLLLVFDEIQTGFGRTGKMWAADYYEVQPDIMLIGKVMGGGFPISAAVFREDIVLPSEEEQEVLSTFSGFPVSSAVSLAVVDVILEEKLPEKAAKMGTFMMGRLKLMQEEHPLIGNVGGIGLMIAIELVKDRNTKEKAIKETVKVVKGCRERGVIFLLSSKPGVGNIIKIKPPMNIDKNSASKALDVLDDVLCEVEKSPVC